MNSQLLIRTLQQITQLSIRTCSTRTGIQYHGFTYYPRTDDFKDPPYEPSKLFLIKRIKSLKGRTKEEKKYLGLLNIDGPINRSAHINVVKNIPEINANLWKIKHLVEIKPITYKGELPKDGDYFGTHLRDTGELVISPKLKPTASEQEATEIFHNDKKHLRRLYLKEYLKKKWINGYCGTV